MLRRADIASVSRWEDWGCSWVVGGVGVFGCEDFCAYWGVSSMDMSSEESSSEELERLLSERAGTSQLESESELESESSESAEFSCGSGMLVGSVTSSWEGAGEGEEVTEEEEEEE